MLSFLRRKPAAPRARSWVIQITDKNGQRWTEANGRKVDAAASKTRHEASGATVTGPTPSTERI